MMPKKSLSETIATSKRDNTWLLSRLNHLWEAYFADVEQANPLFIKFGRYSKLRLGSVRLDKTTHKTFITISSMFRDESVPVEVVDHTIAHELCHYTHGFSSQRPRLHKYPHIGGVVGKELKMRGLGYLIKAYSEWVKEYRKHL